MDKYLPDGAELNFHAPFNENTIEYEASIIISVKGSIKTNKLDTEDDIESYIKQDIERSFKKDLIAIEEINITNQ